MNPYILLIIVLIFSTSLTAQFGDVQRISEHARSSAVKFGDMDSDGDLDVVFNGRFDNAIGWYENLGQGVFGEQHIIHRGYNSAISIDLVDIDNNGYLDVVCTSNYQGVENGILVVKNFGDNSYVADVIDTDHNGVRGVSFVDFNNDSLLDFLTPSSLFPFSPNGIFWYENLGVLGIDSTQSLVVGSPNDPYSLVTIDLDLDGDLDVVYGTRFQPNLYWVENLGNGVFGQENIFKTNCGKEIKAINLADMDSDGDEDIIFSSIGTGFPNVLNGVKWIENLGGANNYSSVVRLNSSYLSIIPVSISINDLDGDGDNDVISGSEWIENNGFGSGAVGISHILGDDQYVESGDVDGDGDIDVLSSSLEILENDGNGNFEAPKLIIKTPYKPVKILVDDFDHSGTNDLIIAAEDKNSICYFDNRGGNIAQAKVILDDTTEIRDIIGFNLNQDNLKDLVYIKEHDIYLDYHSLNSIKNFGGGNFGNERTIFLETSTSNNESIVTIKSLDVDNDGIEDILAFSNIHAYWFKNYGNDSIDTNKQILFTNSYGSSVNEKAIVFDINLDELNDINFNKSSSWGTNYIISYLNQGNGVFISDTILNMGLDIASQFAFGDIDNDSFEDIIVTSESGGIGVIAWYKNNGALGFETIRNVIYNYPINYFPHLAKIKTYDVDGDGDLDIVNSGVVWVENLGGGNFGQANLLGIEYMHDLNNDGALDPIFISENNYFYGYDDSIY
jgi:hypothetical protein